MKEDSKPPVPEDTPNTTPVATIGTNGRAVLKVGSPQWLAWLRYHSAVGDRQRADLMRYMGDTSRWNEWEEPAEWPPTHVGPRENDSRTESGGR